MCLLWFRAKKVFFKTHFHSAPDPSVPPRTNIRVAKWFPVDGRGKYGAFAERWFLFEHMILRQIGSLVQRKGKFVVKTKNQQSEITLCSGLATKPWWVAEQVNNLWKQKDCSV